MKNVELKARLANRAEIIANLQSLGALHKWTRVQTDTYFETARGKLKLREVKDRPAELIAYTRPNHTAETISDYNIYSSENPDSLKKVLQLALQTVSIVRKERILFLWKNVRIHLDCVDGLGDFIEFEAVLSEHSSEKESIDRLAFLKNSLNLNSAEWIDVGYFELLNSGF